MSLLRRNSDTGYPQNFQTLLSAVWLLFFQPVRILKKLCLKLTFNSCSVRHSENCKYIWYLLTNVTFYYESVIYVKIHFSLFYKRLECVDLKEKNRKQMYDQIKRIYNGRRKQFTAFFKFCWKKIWIYKLMCVVQEPSNCEFISGFWSSKFCCTNVGNWY